LAASKARPVRLGRVKGAAGAITDVNQFVKSQRLKSAREFKIMTLHNPYRPANAPASATRSAALPAGPWRAALIAGALGVVQLLMTFWGTVTTLVGTWLTSDTYAHGLAIGPIALYLIWRRRAVLGEIVPAPDARGFVLLAGAAVLWLLARLTATLVIEQFALVAMLQATAVAIVGWRAAAAMLFPLFYLFFAVPFGADLVGPLQDITAFLVVRLLQLFAIPVFVDGHFIAVPGGNFLVAEACAGLRFLIASVALGALFAHLAYRTPWRRLAFVGLSIAVPIAANGMRAFGIIILATVSNHTIAAGFDHLIYGWIFFTAVMLALFWLGARFAEPAAAASNFAPAPSAIAAPALSGWRYGGAVTAAGVILMAFAAAGVYLTSDPRVNALPNIMALEAAVPGAAPLPAGAWRPHFAGPDQTIARRVSRAAAGVDLHIGYYRFERAGAEAVSSAHGFAAASGARWFKAAPAQIAIGGQAVAMRANRLVEGGRERLIWQWYWVGGEFVGDPYRGKLLKLKSLLSGGPRQAAVLVATTEIGGPADDAAARLADFVARLEPLRLALAPPA
jgi:exosortase A